MDGCGYLFPISDSVLIFLGVAGVGVSQLNLQKKPHK